MLVIKSSEKLLSNRKGKKQIKKTKAKAKNCTVFQLKQLLDTHENIVIKICTNRIENLESNITRMQEESKELKRGVKELQESMKFQDELYEKDMKEEKEKLGANFRTNREVQKLVQQNTEMKEQII